MRFVWSTAVKDLRRRMRDPVGLVVWIVVPFAILSLLTLAFGGGDIRPQAHLLVVDHDESFLSMMLLSAFGQGPLAELVLVEQVDEPQGRTRISEGDGSALLVIPEGFAGDVLNERPVTLTLLTNPAQRILPGIIEETLSVIVDATFYAQRLLGDSIRELADGPPDGGRTFPDETIATFSVTVNQLVDRVGDTLFPPAIEFVSEVEDADKPAFDFGALFFTSMFFMTVLFMASGLSGDIWDERMQGTLRRVVTTPQTVTAFFAGKLLAAAILFAGVGLIAISVGAWLFELDPGRVLPAVAWAAFSGTVLTAMFTLVQLFATSQRTANVLSSIVLFPLLLVGGTFFPFEAMPPWLAAIGRWTPNGWALEQFKAILLGTAELASLGTAFAGLVAVGVLFSALGAYRLRRRFAAG